MIQDSVTQKVLGIGREDAGLYYLINDIPETIDGWLKDFGVCISNDTESCIPSFTPCNAHKYVSCTNNVDAYSLWHQRLGRLSDSKLQHVTCVPKNVVKCNDKICSTFPMSKFTKLSFPLSNSVSDHIFQLIHIDIWGPYMVPINGS